MFGTMVFVERGKGEELTPQSHELINLGTALKADGAGPVWAVLIGPAPDSLDEVDRVIEVELPDGRAPAYNPTAYGSALAALIAEQKPDLVLLPNNTAGIDLAPQLSIVTGYPLLTYCTDLSLDNGQLALRGELYYGRINAFVTARAPLIIGVNQGASYRGAAPAAGVAGGAASREKFSAPSSELSGGVRVLEVVEPGAGGVDLSKSEKIVSIGRGIGEKNNIPRAEELSKALAADLGCSRPLVDLGWMPKQRQVGKSGVIVKPKLYLAMGISGAPEHLQGMSGADLIIAVNSDEDAPILNVADYAIIGDMFDVMDAMVPLLDGNE